MRMLYVSSHHLPFHYISINLLKWRGRRRRRRKMSEILWTCCLFRYSSKHITHKSRRCINMNKCLLICDGICRNKTAAFHVRTVPYIHITHIHSMCFHLIKHRLYDIFKAHLHLAGIDSL